MKLSISSLSACLLAVALLLPLGGCGHTGLRFWEKDSLESSIPEEFSPAAVEGQALEEVAVFPITLQQKEEKVSYFDISGLPQEVTWRLQTMNWLDRDRLALVVADGRQSIAGNVIMSKALLFDWKEQEESFVITLPDATVYRVEEVENTLYFYDATTIYAVNSGDFSLRDTAPNASGSAPLGNLLLRRDDSGVVLENTAEDVDNIRVARNDDSGIYGNQMLWAPDGQRFLIARQNLTDQSGNGVLIGSREGEFLLEIDIAGTVRSDDEDDMFSRYEFTPFWSADSRSILVADSSSLRSYSVASGEMLHRVRGPLYNSVSSVRDVFGDQVILCKPAGKSWLTVLLNLSTGESVDLLETPQSVAARFSPDGSSIVAVESENASRIYRIEL